VVIPPWECDPYGTPGGTGAFGYSGKLAARQNMTTNSFLCRPNESETKGVFSVTSKRLALSAKARRENGLCVCEPIDGYCR